MFHFLKSDMKTHSALIFIEVLNRGFGPLKDQTAEMIFISSSFYTEGLILQILWVKVLVRLRTRVRACISLEMRLCNSPTIMNNI